MKRTALLALWTAICMFGPGMSLGLAAQPGDVNDDNAVDLLDALDLARYLSGTTASLPRLDLADVNRDGAVNEADRQLLLRAVIYCVTLDKNPPVVSIISPDEGATMRKTPVTVTSRVTDASPIRSVTCQAGTSTTSASSSGGDQYQCEVALAEGPNSITVKAVDASGNIGSDSVGVNLNADVLPPQVRLTVPSEVLPGSHHLVTAEATDNDRVESVTFSIDGQLRPAMADPPYEQMVDVPEVASEGDIIRVRAVAIDPSGNQGSDDKGMIVVGTRDAEPPVVALAVPPTAAPGERIKIAAAASDNVGVSEVTFLAGTSEFYKDRSEPYETFYVIPPDAPIGSTIMFTARAVDTAGNTGEDSDGVQVIAQFDHEPPVVHLIAPAEVIAGRTLEMSATATDNVRVHQVTFSVDGTEVGTDPEPPYEASFHVAEGTPPRKNLTLVARAEDFSGNVGTDQGQTVVVAPTIGVIAGEVYDVETGLPIEGAISTLDLLDGKPPSPSPVTAVTDARGRYRIPSREGKASLSIAKTAYTLAWREVQVVGGRRSDPLDALLTPLDTNPAAILSVVGGEVVSRGAKATLSIPGGSLVADRTIRLTPVGSQGLSRRLPTGWAPIAAADISSVDAPADEVSFQVNATLSLPVSGGPLPEGTTLVTVRHDVPARVWIVQSTVPTLSTNRDVVSFQIGKTGQYAVVLADKPPIAPPSAIVGQPLADAVATAIPIQPTALITPSPKIIFADPAARSDVQVRVTATTPLQSGTVLRADLDEHYDLLLEGKLFLEPRALDQILYSTQGSVTSAGANSGFTLTPSRSYAPFEFREGEIDIAAFLDADRGAPKGAAVGSPGGSVSGATGGAVQILAGATSETLPVVLSDISQEDFPMSIPNPMTFVGGLRLDLHGGAIQVPSVLSIPLSVGGPDPGDTFIVQLIESEGSSHLSLVSGAIAQVGRLISDTDPLGDGSVPFPGPLAEGRYAFLESHVELGFITGTITDSSGNPLANGLVSVDTFPLLARTNGAGSFVLVAPVGTFHITALDPLTKDIGDLQGSISAPKALARLNGRLSATPPRIVELNPFDGKQGVPLTQVITVKCSEPIAATSIEDAVTLMTGGQPVPGNVSLSPDHLTLFFRPEGLLLSDSTYQLHVLNTIRDLSGNLLQEPAQISFHTEDQTPPPRPQAGNITATIPNSNGFSTVSGSPGTVEPGWTVAVRNLTNGALTTLIVGPDGSFTGLVPAAKTDKLELVIIDQVGNETTLALSRFRDPDGSTVVGSEGGEVQGAGGVVVTIPPDALSDGTIVRAMPVSEADLALPVPEGLAFNGAIRIDLGGVKPSKSLDVSVAAPPGASTADQVLVVRALSLPMRTGWTLVDRAQYVDGRYETASPPFPGVLEESTYGFLKYQGDCVSYVQTAYYFDEEAYILTNFFFFVYDTFKVGSVVVAKSCSQTLTIDARAKSDDRLLTTASAQASSRKDEIAQFGGFVTNNNEAPRIIRTKLPTGGTGERSEVWVAFSQPLDEASVEGTAGQPGIAVYPAGSPNYRIPGKASVAGADPKAPNIAIFRPTFPFPLSRSFNVVLRNIQNISKSANAVDEFGANFPPDGKVIPFTTDTPPEYPSIRDELGKDPGLEHSSDQVILCSDGELPSCTLFIANGIDNSRSEYIDPFNAPELLAIDIDDPYQRRVIGRIQTETNPLALAAVRRVKPRFPGKRSPSTDGTPPRDILVVAGGGFFQYNEDYGKLLLYDVTPCLSRPSTDGENCLLRALYNDNSQAGRKLLSTPRGQEPVYSRVPPDAGIPHGVHILDLKGQFDYKVQFAYVETRLMGVEAVNLREGFNWESFNWSDPDGPDALFRMPGILDLAVLKNRVLASRGLFTPGTLQILSPGLEPISDLKLPATGQHLATAEDLPFDVDGDGQFRAVDELFDIVLVAGDASSDSACAMQGREPPCGELVVLDMSSVTGVHGESALPQSEGPRVVSRIPLPAPASGLVVDRERMLAIVNVLGAGLTVVDLGHLGQALRRDSPADLGAGGLAIQDADHNGRDDRLLFIHEGPIKPGRPAIEPHRGLVFYSSLQDGIRSISYVDWRLQFLDPLCTSATDCPEKPPLVDPDPGSGTGIVSDPHLLARANVMRTGIAADGVSRLIVRLRVNGPADEDVTFCLLDPDGQQGGSDGQYGTLASIQNAPGDGGCITTQSVPAEGGSVAFADYRAPLDFPKSVAEVQNGVTVYVQAKFGPTIIREPLVLHTPPVVLIHGIWSSPSALSTLAQSLNEKGFSVCPECRVDYSRQSADSFHPVTGSKDIFTALKRTIREARRDAGRRSVAAAQVDIVAHSMGGLVARGFLVTKLGGVDRGPSGENSGYLLQSNFWQGSFHKLITIATPHFGTPAANYIMDRRCDPPTMLPFGLQYDSLDEFWAGALIHRPLRGAARDLQAGSDALRALGSTHIRGNVIVGNAPRNGSETESTLRLAGMRVLGDERSIDCILDPRDNSCNDRPARKHDTIVPTSSQSAGIVQGDQRRTDIFEVVHTSLQNAVKPWWKPFFSIPATDDVEELTSEDVSRRVSEVLLSRQANEFLAEFGQAPRDSSFIRSLEPCAGTHNSTRALNMRSSQVVVSLEPVEGTVVKPGDLVHVRFKREGGNNVQGAMFSIAGGLHVIEGNQATFEFDLIVGEVLGRFDIEGVTYGIGPDNYSRSTYLTVVPGDELVAMKVVPSEVVMGEIGETIRLQVFGTDAAGRELDIAKGSSDTTYAVASGTTNVIAIDDDGTVEARGVGQDTIRIAHGAFVEEVTVTVIITNQRPNLEAVSDVTIAAGETVSIQVKATDPDGDSITLSSNDLPAFVRLVDQGNGHGVLEVSPGEGDVGIHTVDIWAVDSGTPQYADGTECVLTIISKSAGANSQVMGGGNPTPQQQIRSSNKTPSSRRPNS